MANTVPILSYANTFSDWYVVTNALSQENNILGKGDYTKDSGTLYLSETTQNALQSNGNIVVQKQLLVQGVGSSGTIQNNLTVGGQVYFTNTTLSLTASGQANVEGQLYALAPNTGLIVANNSTIKGNLTSIGAATFGNTVTVTSWERVGGFLDVTGNTTVTGATVINNTLNVLGVTTLSNNLITALNADSSTLSVANKATVGSVQANTSVLTGTITANTLITTPNLIATAISVSGVATVDKLQANTSVQTDIFVANTSVMTGTVTANTLVTTPNMVATSISGNTLNYASITANTVINSPNVIATFISGNTLSYATITANTVVTSPNVIATSISGANINYSIIAANTRITAPNLIATAISSSGTVTVNKVQANTSVQTTTIVANTSVLTGTVTANTLVTTPNIIATAISSSGTATVDKVQANTSVLTGTVTANTLVNAPNHTGTTASFSGTLYANTIQANSTVNIVNSSQVSNAVTVNITAANNAYPGLTGSPSSNGLISKAILNITGPTSDGNTSYANVSVSSNISTVSVTGSNFASLDVSSLITTANLVASAISSSGTVTVDKVQANTSVQTVNVVANTAVLTGTITANTLVTTPNLIATAISSSGSIFANTIQANSTINVIGSTQKDNSTVVNITTANNSNSSGQVSRALLNITGPLTDGNVSYATVTILANNASAVISNGVNAITITPTSMSGSSVDATLKSLTTSGSVQVGGNFILTGTTVYATNTFTLSAGAAANSNNFINVDRTQSPGASNASIRWNESDKYWDIKDVVANTYNKIIANNDTSTSVTLKGYLRANGIVSTQTSVTAAANTNVYLDLASYDNFTITPTTNMIFVLLNIGTKVGSSGSIIIKQDATGGRTFTKATEMKTPLGGATITQYTAANSISMISYYVYDSSTVLINYIGNFA